MATHFLINIGMGCVTIKAMGWVIELGWSPPVGKKSSLVGKKFPRQARKHIHLN